MAKARGVCRLALLSAALLGPAQACSSSSPSAQGAAAGGSSQTGGSPEAEAAGAGGELERAGTSSGGANAVAGDFGAGAASLPALAVPAILPIPSHVPLSAQPPPAVHPRLFFTAEDLPELRKRATDVPAAIAAVIRLRDEADTFQATPLYVALRDGTSVTSQTFSAQLVSDPTYMFLGTSRGGFYGQLAGSAYLAILDDDQPLEGELASVLSRAAVLHATSYTPNKADPTASDASLDLGFSYDLLYDALDVAQRSQVRSLLASMTSGRAAFGVSRAPQQQSTGDMLQSDSLVLTSLSIEGEPGYDASIFQNDLAKLENFSSRYGIHSAGYVHEDWGFFGRGMHQGSLMLLAAARRGHDLFETGRVYQALLQPFYDALPWSPGKLAGHGAGPSFNVGLGASALYPVLSYLFPDDALVGFAMRQAHAADGDASQQEAPLPEAIFGNAFDADASLSSVAESLRLPTTFFDADRGILNARSGFASDATVVSFDCRMDTWDLTRVQADRNNFTLLAKERAWIVDGTLGQASSAWHANISIDGVGPSDAPRMPALLQGFADQPLFTFATGDATAAYTYDRQGNAGAIDTGFVWQDFRYKPEGTPEEWRTHAVRAEAKHLPLLHARRSVVLGRSPSPFVLVVDEIAKDAAAHTYEWRAPVPAALVGEERDGALLLRYGSDAPATAPRLLVRVLAPASAAAPVLDVRQSALSPAGKADNPGLSVSADAVAPRFVILLVPLDADEPPPDIAWDDGSLELRVTRADGGQTLAFQRAADGHLDVASAALLP